MCNLFVKCFQFWPPGAQKTVFLALAQLTDKMDPMHIIPKVPSEPHNDAHVIFLVFRILATRGQKTAHRQDGPHVYYAKRTA